MGTLGRITLVEPGRLPYQQGLDLQQEAVGRVHVAKDPVGTLILLEHDPVFTLGRFANLSHLLVPNVFLQNRGMAVVQTNRGGQITWHGPGQLVGYPILRLDLLGLRLKDYITALETMIIGVLGDLGIDGRRREGMVGVWAGEAKIASIGVHVHRRVTTHGFAVNLCNDLEPFQWMNPCGLKTRVTTASEMTKKPVLPDAVIPVVCRWFAEVFHVTINPVDDSSTTY